VIASDPANATYTAGAGDREVPPALGTGPRLAAGPSTPPPSPPRGADINAQLAQARELEAKLAEEYHTVRLLRASMAGEASARGERAREFGRQARDRINTDFNVDNPDTPRERARSSSLPQHCCGPCPPPRRPRRGTCTARRKRSSSKRPSNSRKLGVPHSSTGECVGRWGAQGPEPSVHAGGAAECPANSGRMPAKERILDTRWQAQDGDARNAINARRMSNAEARAAAGYHPRRGGRYDGGEDLSPTPEPPGTRVFSREIRTTTFPQRFRQPTTIVKYNGETDPRVWLNDYHLACQLGGATSDEVIIHNLPLHLADSARTWLEHLPASQVYNWDDLVHMFVETSRARTCALGTPGTCALATRSPANRSETSYGASQSAVRSSQVWRSPKSCTPSSRAPHAGILCASLGAAL
jgi:hypothetical protein